VVHTFWSSIIEKDIKYNDYLADFKLEVKASCTPCDNGCWEINIDHLDFSHKEIHDSAGWVYGKLDTVESKAFDGPMQNKIGTQFRGVTWQVKGTEGDIWWSGIVGAAVGAAAGQAAGSACTVVTGGLCAGAVPYITIASTAAGGIVGHAVGSGYEASSEDKFSYFCDKSGNVKVIFGKPAEVNVGGDEIDIRYGNKENVFYEGVADEDIHRGQIDMVH
jgi:hypothetical protein